MLDPEHNRCGTDFLRGQTSWSRPWSLFVLQHWCAQNVERAFGMQQVEETPKLRSQNLRQQTPGDGDHPGPQRSPKSDPVPGVLWGKSGNLVVDSQSSDATGEIAREFGAQVVQFHYKEDGPKSASGPWTLCPWPTIGFCYSMPTRSHAGIDGGNSACNPESRHQRLLHCLTGCIFWAAFCATAMPASGNCRCSGEAKGSMNAGLKDQDASMADMEVHEHLHVKGAQRASRIL